MSGNIAVGTASWTDPSLIRTGLFYPTGCSSPEDRLRYYCTQFPFVEVDSSYYAMLSEANAAKWAQRSPDGFTFNVKAFRALTQHQTPRKSLPPDIARSLQPSNKINVYYKDLPAEIRDELWTRFIQAVQPLAAAGKLGALHFQFPPWFIAKRDNYMYLEEVRGQLEGFTVAIEFRSASWFDELTREATLKVERDNAFVNVVVDEPQGFKSSVPGVWEATNDELAIVRLHGRNTSTWEAKGATAASDRFNYDYSDEELTEIAQNAQKLAAHVRVVQVVMNNNYQDQGVRNGRSLQRMLVVDGAQRAPTCSDDACGRNIS
jgi:uncharacterized protein YecE (DUF72 family)